MIGTAGLLYACALLVAARAIAIGPTAELRIVNANISPDGFERGAVLAGGTFPGPVIRGTKGSSFRLNVVNALTDNRMRRSTSIHWHGIHQRGSSWADGPSFVTQCPIGPGDSFLYDFTVADQAGTFWYHSHTSTQYCDGLRGAFIVYDPHDPYKHLYDVDDESTIITLADWFHVYAKDALVVGNPPPEAASILINGKGRYRGGPLVPLSVVNVKRSKRYRFRIIAMTCDPSLIFSIDQHKLTIIEADGVNTEPLEVDSIQIFAAQRYSVVFNANQAVGNYWIRASTSELDGVSDFANATNSAILRYAGAPNADPTTPERASTKPLKETDLHPLTNPKPPGLPVPGGADVVINLKQGFNSETWKYEMNGVPFIAPTVPVLLQILSGAGSAQDLLPPGSIYELPRNKTIEISLPGTSAELDGPHPFHLHGHEFYVVRSANSTAYNFVNPVRRDTVSTGLADSNTTIRFVTDNDGPWFLHCHIDWHLELGLAVVFAENIPGIKQSNHPKSWDELCPKYEKLPPELQ